MIKYFRLSSGVLLSAKPMTIYLSTVIACSAVVVADHLSGSGSTTVVVADHLT